jgi:hypothetical protein
MQILNLASGLPVYLPYDIAHVPFGDPFNDVTITSSHGLLAGNVPGYAYNANDLVMFSVNSGNTIAGNVSANFVYYVVASADGANIFNIAVTKSGAPVGWTTTSNYPSGQVVAHLISNQVDGTVAPFKSGASCVALNLGSNPVWLVSAADTYGGTPGVVPALGQTPPGGPGAFSVVAALAAGAAALVTLNNDWIKASNGAIVLLQN